MLRVLIAWWGALDNGGETIGDLYAVCRIADLCRSKGHSFDVASGYNYEELLHRDIKRVNWRSVDTKLYDRLCFVCGPVIGDSAAFRNLIDRFQHTRKIAVGVSLLPKDSPSAWNPFDLVLARDGAQSNIGDIAFVPLCKPTGEFREPLRVGLCYRGHQQEYGMDACLSAEAERIGNQLAALASANTVSLDTRLNMSARRDRQILEAFASCDLIISTRLHGGLLALSLGLPFLAIDQIRGGGKVSAVLRALAWPHVVQLSVSGTKQQTLDWITRLKDPITTEDILHSQALLCRSVSSAEALIIDALEFK